MKTPQKESTKYNRYSVAFKMQVVEEVENGLITAESARKLYNIPGKATIGEWVEKYGINQRINKAVYVMTREEELEVLRLRKENRRLQKALDDSHLKNLALESLVEIAGETYGTDLKKSFGSQLLKELKRKLIASDSDRDSE
jgi:transposase-like protein